MGCGQTACKVCGNKYKACQLINGMCSSCYSKEQNKTQNVNQPTVKQ